MKKLLLFMLITLTLASCSKGEISTSTSIDTSIPTSSSSESIDSSTSFPTSDPNDVGGDNLQSDWEW